jgi:hypothetical protein
MSFPQDIQMKGLKAKDQREHYTRFLEVEEHPLINGDIYENWMDSHESSQHLQQQQKTQGGLHASGLKMERMETQPPFTMFRPPKLHVLASRPRSTKGQTFEFGLGSILIHELGSFVEGSKNPTT